MNDFDGWFWWILAALLAFAEIFTPGVYLIWLAMAAVLVGALGLVIEWGLIWQMAAFALFAIGIVLLARKLPYGSGGGLAFRSKDSDVLNQRNLSYIGREVVLQQPIEGGQGKIRIDDSVWLASCKKDLPAGARVRVVGADGMVLQIQEAGETNNPAGSE